MTPELIQKQKLILSMWEPVNRLRGNCKFRPSGTWSG